MTEPIVQLALPLNAAKQTLALVEKEADRIEQEERRIAPIHMAEDALRMAISTVEDREFLDRHKARP